MQLPIFPQTLRASLDTRPTVGRLMDLCEENYRLLRQLMPHLQQMHGSFCSSREDGVDLHLEIQEQTPYTTLIHLTYYFGHRDGHGADPEAVLRVYHDARQAEVVRLRQSVLPLKRGRDPATLRQKWRANLFLCKWLGFCLHQGHRFSPESRHPSHAADPVLETG